MDVEFELTSTSGHTIRGRRWTPPAGPSAPAGVHRWLLLHGWLDNCDSFQLLAPLLQQLNTEPVDILALDLSGHGLSDHRRGPYHAVDYAAEVLQCADSAFGPNASFSLLGHSLGALVALLAAGTVPERVLQLVLLEGMGMSTTPPADNPKQLAKALGKLPSGRAAKTFESVHAAAETRAQKNVVPDEAFNVDTALLLARRGTEKLQDGRVKWVTDPWLLTASRMPCSDAAVNAFAAAVTAPTLILTTADGLYARYTMAKRKIPLFWFLQVHWRTTTAIALWLKSMLSLVSWILCPQSQAHKAVEKIILGLRLLARAGCRIRSFKNRTLWTLPSGGHHPQLTKPAAVAQAIVDWSKTQIS